MQRVAIAIVLGVCITACAFVGILERGHAGEAPVTLKLSAPVALKLSTPAGSIFPGGNDALAVLSEDRREIRIIDAATGKSRAERQLREGTLLAFVPLVRSSTADWIFVALTRGNDQLDESADVHRYFIDMFSANLRPLGSHDFESPGEPTMGPFSPGVVIWDRAYDGAIPVALYPDLTFKVLLLENYGPPPFELLSVGSENVILALYPKREQAALFNVDEYSAQQQDKIFVDGLIFRDPENFSVFVPGSATGGTGDAILVNSELGVLTILSVKKEARIGSPIQIRLPDNQRRRKLFAAADRELSFLLVGALGSDRLTTFRRIGGGFVRLEPIVLENPIRDVAVIHRQQSGEKSDVFAFLREDGREIRVVPDLSTLQEEEPPDSGRIAQPFTDSVFYDPKETARLQRGLAELGYPVSVDGVIGPTTTAAIRAFQTETGLETGKIDATTLETLSSALNDVEFDTLQDALEYFSKTRFDNISAIKRAPERYKHIPILVTELYAQGFHNRNLIAAILANLIFETSQLSALEERGTGDRYEGRKSLGNSEPGDGARFKGRGYVMIVGRSNYTRFGKAIGVKLVEKPELAAEPEVAAKIAAYFFKTRLRDQDSNVDMGLIRKILDGRNQHLEDVGRLYALLIRGS